MLLRSKTSIPILILFLVSVGFAQDSKPTPFEPTESPIPTSSTTTAINDETTSAPTTEQNPTPPRPAIPINSTSSTVQPTLANATIEGSQNHSPTTSWKPFYPSSQESKCYYFRTMQYYWTGLRWTYNAVCHSCCHGDSFKFDRCNLVHPNYCDVNHGYYDNYYNHNNYYCYNNY